jgi:hypothetical protein
MFIVKEQDNYQVQRTSNKMMITINSMALGRERTILTELPPLVGEVSAKFSG